MKNLLSPLILTSGLVSGPLAFGNHVDFLSDAGFDISANDSQADPTTFTSSGNTENIIGGEREVMLWADFGSYNAVLDTPAGPGAAGANNAIILNVAPTGADAADSFGTLRLAYDGQGSTGLGGLDFDTAWDSLNVNFNAISGGALDLRLAISDTNGNTGNAALGALDSAGVYAFAFDRSEFVNAGVDFTSLDSIVFDIETIDPGVSFGVASITREVIPEPSSSLLLGLSMIGLAARRRR